MPFPRWVARLNFSFTNRLLGPLARRLAGMGVIVHVGRKPHRLCRTPVMVFRRNHGFVIALPYGRESQWVQNVLTANGCALETRSQTMQLFAPSIMGADRST
jgi:hypothetical protein